MEEEDSTPPGDDAGRRATGDGALEPANSKRRKISRAIRIAIVLAVVAGFLFHFSIQIRKYLNYPKITIRSSDKIRNTFPDVTICSSSFFHEKRNIKPVPGKSIFEDIFQKNLAAIWNTVLFNTSDTQRIPDTQTYDYVRNAKFSILPYMAASDAGPIAGDFVFNCRYNSHECNFRDMVTFWHPAYGACFTFKPTDRFLDSTDVRAGLELMLFGKIGQKTADFALTMTTLVKGKMVTVHPVDSWPDVEKHQYAVDSSRTLQVDYTFSPLKQLNIPEGACIGHSGQQQLCRVEPLRGLVCRSFNVTDDSVRLARLQEGLHLRCRCISFEWPIPSELRNATSCHFVPAAAFLHAGFQGGAGDLVLQFANNTNVSMSALASLDDLRSRFSCYERYKASMRSKSNEEVVNLCHQNSYEVTSVGTELWQISEDDDGIKKSIGAEMVYRWLEVTRGLREANITSIWEKFPSLDYFAKRTININAKFDDKIISDDLSLIIAQSHASIKKESISIYVYSSALWSSLSEEVPTYDELYFLADAGGILGLWIGFSFYTLSELIEWLISLQMQKYEHSAQGSETMKRNA